jgi:hypothetical protein
MSVPAHVAAAAAEADSTLATLAAAARDGTLSLDQLRGQQPNVTQLPSPPAPEPVPAPAPEPAPAPDPAPAPEPVSVPTNLQAELSRLSQQLATTQGRLAAQQGEEGLLRRQLETLQAEIQLLRNPPAPPAPLFSSEETEAFGPENVDLVQRIIRQEVGTRLEAVERSLNEIRGAVHRLGQTTQQVQQTTQRSAQERLLDALAEEVPDWEAVNVDTRFLDWLEKVDMLSKQKYGAVLGDAYENADSARVIHIFKLYKQENGIASPAPAPAPAPPAPPAGVDPTITLAPSPGAPTPAPTQPAQPKIWTTAEVDKLYEDYQRKIISEPEFKRREAEYLIALREGRVR